MPHPSLSPSFDHFNNETIIEVISRHLLEGTEENYINLSQSTTHRSQDSNLGSLQERYLYINPLERKYRVTIVLDKKGGELKPNFYIYFRPEILTTTQKILETL
jgi:hypothetical protein